MSETPRTDAEAYNTGLLLLEDDAQPDSVVQADFSRTLERELAAKTAEVERLRKDARRYQWFRDNEASIKRTRRATEQELHVEIFFDGWVRRKTLDEAIDAAMATEREES